MADVFITGRPTVYNGIKMRSRLEAAWASKLDQLGLEWKYEPVCFGTVGVQYLPDFKVIEPKRTVYLEVKGVLPDPAPVRRRMETVWASEPLAHLVIAKGTPLERLSDWNAEWFTKTGNWWLHAPEWQAGFRWPDQPDWWEWEISGPNPPATIDYEILAPRTDI